MKKALPIIVVTILSLFSDSLYSAEPLVRFYLQDGSSKQFNLSDIESMKFPNAPETLQLQVFTNDGKTYYYPAQLIDTITISIGQYSNQYINLWHDGFKWDFAIHKIDSISIYYTTYVAVTIGTQHWMYRNLNVDHYRNGDSIAETKIVTDWVQCNSGAWCYYDNDTVVNLLFGKLYNWYAVTDPRELAPKGWHIATEDEFSLLVAFLYKMDEIGGKLKSVKTNFWYPPNFGATNESGFSGLPGGFRSPDGKFYVECISGNWWSLNGYNISATYFLSLFYDSATIGRSLAYDKIGLSVRCVRDF